MDQSAPAFLGEPAIWCDVAMRLLGREANGATRLGGWFEMIKNPVSGSVSKRAFVVMGTGHKEKLLGEWHGATLDLGIGSKHLPFSVTN